MLASSSKLILGGLKHIYIMNDKDRLDYMYDTIVELGIATIKEIELVTSINGYNVQAMDDIVYCREGYNTLSQYLELEMQES